ncbi:MAG: hypothetical protein JO063_05920 [Pseudonocardiales bacterium]|nr:hypothetical protein [Pseudonocardiales bacterium]MBV9028980.1 hypothetical protein [Pseudonocardiales bacterium]MBW0009646.1 hypothetical protein [Pseudonocardiales bacterium]
MSTVIVIEVIAAILVLAAVVRYAVRDTRRRSTAGPRQQPASENTGEAPTGEREVEQPLSEVADRT